MRAALFAVLFAVATAGSCPVDYDPDTGPPPKPVAGNWVGELFGVRFRLTMTETGEPSSFFNETIVGGSGWLVYGDAPAESVAVALQGFNGGGPAYRTSFEVQRPNGTGGVYGNFYGALQEDGSLLGPFTRAPNIEPSPSPWTANWPEGVAEGSLRLTRQ